MMGWVSAGCRDRGDPLERAHDGLGPRPVRWNSWSAPSPARGQFGGHVQEPVTQRLGLGLDQVGCHGEQPQPSDEVCADRSELGPCRVDREVLGREPSQAGVLRVSDAVLDPGMGAVAGLAGTLNCSAALLVATAW